MALPVPSPRTFAVNEVEVASYLNSVRDALTFLLNPPLLEVVQNTLQSVANNAWTDVSQDATVVDSYGMHSNVTNNARGTAVVSGWYLPVGVAAFASNSTGFRGSRFAKNGTPVQGTVTLGPAIAGTVAYPAVSLPIFLNVGDYVTLQGYQSSGGALNTFLAADMNPAFALYFLHV